MDLPGCAVIALIVAVYLVGGRFIDALALIMPTIPIFYPIVLDLGCDPIWFGVIIVLVALVLGTAFFVVFPQLAVWLPNLLYG